MTREEAKKDLYYGIQFDTLKINNFIDKIFDNFEVRSCKDCMYCRQFSDLGLCDVQRTYVNMKLIKYCGKWESKDD